MYLISIESYEFEVKAFVPRYLEDVRRFVAQYFTLSIHRRKKEGGAEWPALNFLCWRGISVNTSLAVDVHCAAD